MFFDDSHDKLLHFDFVNFLNCFYKIWSFLAVDLGGGGLRGVRGKFGQ